MTRGARPQSPCSNVCRFTFSEPLTDSERPKSFQRRKTKQNSRSWSWTYLNHVVVVVISVPNAKQGSHGKTRRHWERKHSRSDNLSSVFLGRGSNKCLSVTGLSLHFIKSIWSSSPIASPPNAPFLTVSCGVKLWSPTFSHLQSLYPRLEWLSSSAHLPTR